MKTDTKSTFLYLKIYEDIKNDIEKKVYAPGDIIPTEMEIIEKYNVSRITAIRAVKELEKQKYVYRVRKKGTVVNSLSERITYSSDSKNVIPIILPFSESIGFGILNGAQNEARQHGIMISVYNTDHNEEMEIECLKKVYDFKTLGVVIYPAFTKKTLPYYSKLLLENIPIVAIDRGIDFFDIPLVSSDNFTSSYEVTKYLIDKGHKRIAFYCEDIFVWESSVHTRFKGYCKALVDSGFEINNDYIFETEPYGMIYDQLDSGMKNSFDRERYCVESVITKISDLHNPPTAIVFLNDFSAAAFIKYSIKKGIKIPDDISVVGFDNLSFCDHIEVPLTSCEQNFFAIGKLAVKLILRQISNKPVEKINLLPTKIIERKSVKDLRKIK